MRQRLGLATALVGDPNLLILDEPSSGLDPAGMMEIRQLIREEAECGTTVFFSSHILPEVEAVCDRVGILRDGRLTTVDTVDGLRETLHTESTVTLSVENTHLNIDEIAGVSSVTTDDSQLRVTCTDPAAKAAVIRHAADTTTVRDVQIDDASLEELFTMATADERINGENIPQNEVDA
jgi:ABC-2 type transport system ATP-binding protein